MIQFSIEQNSLSQPLAGITPTHKIILKRGAETAVFWYLQPPCPDATTELGLDAVLVQHLYEQGQGLMVGDFLYFSHGQGNDYHLHRLGRDRFTLKMLG